MSAMRASDVMAAIMNHFSGAAIVPEVSISDGEHMSELGEVLTPDRKPIRRIDALMFDGLQRTAIEIKVSLADYRRDTYGKREPWQRVTHRFIYAVPAGLLAPADMPFDCGVWEVHPDGALTVLRKARIRKYPEQLPQHVVQTLAYRACGRSSIRAQVTA